MCSIVTASHVCFSYPSQSTPALKDVSLTIGQGEFVAVLGTNGSGKSTLLKAIDGLLQGEAEGSIEVFGLDPLDASQVPSIRRNCGVVFQDPDSQSVASLVEDEAAFGARSIGARQDELKERVSEALDAAGLSGFEQKLVHELSGGQKQRVALAGALAMRPKLLLLDEPSSMLDPSGRKQLMETVGHLHERGMTILLVTHHIEEAKFADRVLVLDQGELVLEGTPGEVFRDGTFLHELGLELPFELELARLIEGRQRRRAASEAGAQQPAAGRPREAAPVVELESASFSYALGAQKKSWLKRGRKALCEPEHWELSNIDVHTKPGRILGIIGPMGSGKTTLLQTMAGLLAPQRGRALICGINTNGSPKERRFLKGKVGLAFQHPEQQLFASSVLEDVAFGPRNLGFSKEEADVMARNALAKLGLNADRIANESPFLLSGGMQRRVALAGILAMEPTCVALDEPAAGLDPSARKALFRMLRALSQDGLGIAMTTHSMEDAATECDELIVMDKGGILLRGTPSEVFCSENASLLDSLGLSLPWPARYALAHGLVADHDLPLSMQALADIMTTNTPAARVRDV